LRLPTAIRSSLSAFDLSSNAAHAVRAAHDYRGASVKPQPAGRGVWRGHQGVLLQRTPAKLFCNSDSPWCYDRANEQNFGTFAAIARWDMLSIFIEKLCEICCTALAPSLASARTTESESQDLLGKLSITQQNSRHSGKFLIVDITFKNDNSFPLKSVVVSCKISGDPARPQDSRGVTIRQNVSRGDTTVSGIEFPVTHDKAQGGPCKVDSAERAP
jgi:hypothetical protein